MARRWLFPLVLLPLIGLLVLAGCGAPARAGTSALAAAHQPPMTVHVVRTSAFPRNHIPPFERTVTDAARVQRLYATLAALRALPAGVLHCPADFGVGYQLTFYRGAAPAARATVEASGCGVVRMDDQTRWWVPDTAFWQQFADALGVPRSAVYPMVPRASGPSAPQA